MSRSGRTKKGYIARSAKECAYLATFVALAIAAQTVLAVLPNVEVVTVLFVSYAFVFGVRRGMLAATAFALLRQLVFGFYPTVLVLYLVHFNMLSLTFGLLGKNKKRGFWQFILVVIIACVCTCAFTAFDNILTPFWYGYSERATKAYFTASVPFLISHVISVAISVSVLFLPLTRVFLYIDGKKK